MATSPARQSLAPAGVFSSAKILVVEDEAIVAEDIAYRLRSLGYDVVGAANSGEEALRQARLAGPDLVLMDIMLKGAMDGVEAAEQISRNLSLPVVFLTAHGDPATFQRAKSTVPRGYVLKPFSEADLHRNIELALGQHREASNLERARKRLYDTLRSIGEGIVTTDSLGRITFLNEAAEEMIGRPSAEVAGLPIDDVLGLTHLEGGEPVQSSVTESLRLEQAVSSAAPLRLRSAQGIDSIIEESASPVVNAGGQTVGGIVLLRVLADRRTGEDERSQLISALRASTQISTDLRMLFRICSWCRRIHTSNGAWKTLEELLNVTGDVPLSHGICPVCVRKVSTS